MSMDEGSAHVTPFSIALEELGVAETPGPAANQRIIEYHSTTTLQGRSDEIPWCSSFVNWCVLQAGIKGTGSAAAKSWLGWGEPCAPEKGCIVILSRGNNPAVGHVGFFAGDYDSERITVLGGNQQDCVCYSVFGKSRVLGYRRPKEK